MIHITVDTTHASARIDKMLRRLDHVGRVEVGAVLSHWQISDLHRTRPFTKRLRSQGTARTILRPHSLYEMRRSRRFGSRVLRRAKRRATFVLPRAFLHYSTRPILRANMLELLRQRMIGLAAHIKW